MDEYFQTERPGIFAAGNVLHVHDLVDFVSMEAEKLADSAARYIKEGKLPACEIQVKTDKISTIPFHSGYQEQKTAVCLCV